MVETIERIGVCQNKSSGAPGLFHRLRIKMSRKFRVWPMAGDDRSMDLDPVEYSERYATVQEYRPT